MPVTRLPCAAQKNGFCTEHTCMHMQRTSTCDTCYADVHTLHTYACYQTRVHVLFTLTPLTHNVFRTTYAVTRAIIYGQAQKPKEKIMTFGQLATKPLGQVSVRSPCTTRLYHDGRLTCPQAGCSRSSGSGSDLQASCCTCS